MIVAARSPVPSTTHASTLGRKKMEDRLIIGSPAIHGHQIMGVLNMFLRKSTRGFMTWGMFAVPYFMAIDITLDITGGQKA
jgi:hypothetical protein